MHVDPAAAVVVLGRKLSFSVLVFQALKEVHHGFGVAIHCSQQVVLPAAVLGGFVETCVQASVQFCEDVGRVQSLQARGLHAAAAALLHLVKDKDVVGKAELPWGHGLEQRGEVALALHVHQSMVLLLPVERGERLALEDQTQSHPGASILAAADAGPHRQVIHELQKFEVLTISDDAAQHLSHKAALHAVPVLKLCVLAVLLWGQALSTQTSGVRGSLDCFAHGVAEV